MNRLLAPAERMTDRFDQAYTLNFTTIVTLRGPLSQGQLLRALRCLERRHPLLRARVERPSTPPGGGAGEPRFVVDQAAEIPLQIEHGGVDALLERASETLAHCVWSDAGPHAELTWLQHGPEHGSLLLRQHHVVSDGSSGILLMRDLLRFTQHAELAHVEPLPSPGQDAFFPDDFGAFKASVLEQLQQRPPKPTPALRLSRFDGDQAIEARRPLTRRVQLDVPRSRVLAQRARQAGASVHGVLMAAIARAIADETGQAGLQRLVHPVDLRRYLRELTPAAPPIGDAVGYYVSSVTTEHTVETGEPLAPLARAITEAVRAGKAAREPLLSAPIRGPLLVERTGALELAAFRELAEQKLFNNTIGVSNLGPLERLGAEPQVGALAVEDFFFVAASSIMNQLGGTAVGFRDRVSLQLGAVEPLVSQELLEALSLRTRAQLEAFTHA